MIVEFDASFEKSLKRVRNKMLYNRIEKLIRDIEHAKALEDVPNMLKLTGYQNYYRYRIGSYRIGIEKISTDICRLIVVAHRKDIYTIFP